MDLLNTEQKLALSIMNSGKSMFLTGSAGTGKSFVIQKYFNHAVKIYGTFRVFKTSSTGVSAIIIGGITLHKFGGIFIGEGTPDDLIKKMPFSAKDRWRDTKVLFIDEISMIHPALFDKLDIIAKKLRRSDLPFGGIQVICSGDFFQLSPISNDGEDRFCFESKCWDLLIQDRSVTLVKIMRQSDEKFQSLLTDLKYGKINDENKKLLESRVDVELINKYGIEPTILFSKNVDVNYINDKKLKMLLEKETPYTYTAKYEILYNKTSSSKSDAIKKVSELTKDFIPDEIILCVGCQVVFKKNISELIANGTRGIVSGFHKPNEFSEYFPEVTLLNGIKYLALPIEFEYEVLNEYKIVKKQIPIKLAFSCSIHSSQGSSLDYVKADLGPSIFAYGQFYVCASRVRTIEGLSLIDFDFNSAKAHPKVLAKYPPKKY
jgi:ATP-dependent DNA helicase PIF1